MLLRIHKYIFLFVISVVFLLPNVAFASAAPGDITNALNEFNRPTGISEASVTTQISTGMLLVYQLTGTIFFIMALYAGIRWMTASGNEEVVTKARNTMVSAVVGMVLIVSAYGITLYLTTRLTDDFGSGSGAVTGGIGSGDNKEAFEEGCCFSQVDDEWINWNMAPEHSCEMDALLRRANDDNIESTDWQWSNETDPATCAQSFIDLP